MINTLAGNTKKFIDGTYHGREEHQPKFRSPPKNSQLNGLVPVDRALQTGYYLGSSGQGVTNPEGVKDLALIGIWGSRDS